MRELQKRMDSREFSEWIAFASVEPIGPTPAAQSAALMALYANAHSKKRYKPDSFYFSPWAEPELVSGTPNMRNIFAQLAGVLPRNRRAAMKLKKSTRE